MRLAQGSGTVAMITAASVTAPLVAGIGLSPLLAALACCAGSMVFSYFNDSYFWVVTRFTGLDGIGRDPWLVRHHHRRVGRLAAPAAAREPVL